MLLELSRRVWPFKKRAGSNPLVPIEVQQFGNERSLYPRFTYSVNTSACIIQSSPNLLDFKSNKRIIYDDLYKIWWLSET
jgi:hypothetical protein